MSLTDVMSGAGLAVYAEIAMVIFLVIFVGVAANLMLRRDRAELIAASRMPLEDTAADPTEREVER